MPNLDLSGAPLPSLQLAGVLAKFIGSGFNGAELQLGGAPFDRVHVASCFARGLGESFDEKCAVAHEFLQQKFPGIGIDPQRVREAVGFFEKQYPGARHPLSGLAPNLAQDPQEALAEIIAVTDVFPFVDDGLLVILLRRPMPEATLKERLAEITGIPTELLGQVHDVPVCAFDNFCALNRLVATAHKIFSQAKIPGLVELWPGEMDYVGLQTLVPIYAKLLPTLPLLPLLRASSLVRGLIQQEDPREITGFLAPDLTAGALQRLQQALTGGARRGRAAPLLTTDSLVKGLATRLDDLMNAAPSGFSALYARLNSNFLEHRRNLQMTQILPRGDLELYLDLFLAREASQALLRLMPETYCRFVPPRGSPLARFEGWATPRPN